MVVSEGETKHWLGVLLTWERCQFGIRALFDITKGRFSEQLNLAHIFFEVEQQKKQASQVDIIVEKDLHSTVSTQEKKTRSVRFINGYYTHITLRL